jgi:hypothetical protein
MSRIPQPSLPQQVNIDISKATDILCPSCQQPYFMEAMRLKRLSIFVSPTGREEIINIQTLLCVGCGAEYKGE